MSLFKKIFGKKDPVEEMRRLYAQQDWASLLNAASRVEKSALDEGSWAQKSGNLLRAREDYQLAIELARSAGIRERAEAALSALDRGELPPSREEAAAGPAIHAGCNSGCSSATGPAVTREAMDLDEEARLELLLATMPGDLAERYLAAGTAFRQAWLAAQDGDDGQAMELLAKVPEAERNALFLFERGALMLRNKQPKKAYQDLQAALAAEPDLFPAYDALVEALLATGRIGELEKSLKQNLAAERFIGYSWARLAELHARRQEPEPALAAGLKAIEEGIMDSGLYTLCAQLLEQAERFDEAEALLKRLPGGGCGGGAHPLLAEFWIRRGQHYDRALESFKGAMRQERDNPRWLLRISQVYLAKGWRKEAAEQIELLMSQGGLPEQIRAEVKSVADQLQQN